MRTIAKNFLNWIADIWANASGFRFPQKYGWREKFIMLSGRYERETGALLRRIVKPGDTVVDIGAHIGYFTRRLSKDAGPRGRVFAFEPEPGNFALLRENTRHCANVECVRAAVSDSSGTATLHIVPGSTGCHSLVGLAGVPLAVPTILLDEFIAGKNMREVTVVKMDIEGGEPLALKGMSGLISSGKCALVMEFNPAALLSGGTAPEKFLASLEEQGFAISAILPQGLEPLSSREESQMHALRGNDSVNIYAVRKK
ncbi:MAG: FkbM family methyltransferase [bacterium]|nr:FkbM family methyltransferase [bacterium]